MAGLRHKQRHKLQPCRSFTFHHDGWSLREMGPLAPTHTSKFGICPSTKTTRLSAENRRKDFEKRSSSAKEQKVCCEKQNMAKPTFKICPQREPDLRCWSYQMGPLSVTDSVRLRISFPPQKPRCQMHESPTVSQALRSLSPTRHSSARADAARTRGIGWRSETLWESYAIRPGRATDS
jgi:hypothetical protein